MKKVKGLIYKGKFDVIEKGLISQENLAKLSNNLLKRGGEDFSLNSVGSGFPTSLCEELIKYIPENKNSKILIFNDITFELYNILIKSGYKNIFPAFGAWNINISKKDKNIVDKSRYTFEIIKDYIKYSFENKIKVYKIEEIFNMNVKFDLIISNPPYKIGNKIINSFINKAKESIVLAPLSCYKGNNVYKHIRDLQLVNPKAFKDASITNNLNIAKLIDRKLEQRWEDIESMTFNEKYREYYILNISKINNKNKFKLTNKKEILDKLIPGIDFIVPQKVTNNGVHTTQDCIDYKFNFLHIKDSLINNKGTYSNIWVNDNIHDANICKNIIQFWYKNPLMNDLLFGLNSEYGDLNKAIPHIDWSKKRDYEHCSLDDIMKWLDEDNN